MRLGLKARSKDDLIEKIGPLIESVTTAREMVPSDLTQDYGSVVFPDPLTTSEVRGCEDHEKPIRTHETRRIIVISRDAENQIPWNVLSLRPLSRFP